MADFDVAAHNFTMNTLRGMSTGGGVGSAFSTELQGAFSGSVAGYSGFESTQKTIQEVLSTIAKVFAAVKAQVDAINPANALGGLSIPSTPINAGQKPPGLFSSKG